MAIVAPITLTVDGLKQLHGDLLALRVRREGLAAEIAASPEDAGNDLQTELLLANHRIAELEAVLARARPRDDAERVPGIVGIGSTVTVRWDGDGDEVYTIVDPAEIAPSVGRISHESPVGQVLLARRVGDRAEVDTHAGPHWLEIVAVEA